jgi:2-phospho-L-lactate transferase/gluconeogenesis factor (CofD/UPF0052 family)
MPERSQINLVLFSGGSGTHSITEALRRHPQIRLRILINAYDDGHSTGRLRKFIPSMLGPSDVRKNISRLMPSAERCHKSLQLLSDHRLPVGVSREAALLMLNAIIAGEFSKLDPPKIAEAFRALTVGQAEQYRSFLATFLEYFHGEGREDFDFTDCALGNLLFAGCFLQQGRDFNRTIAAFSRFYEVAEGTLLNVTRGENLYLVAEKEDGAMLLGEADIVAAQSSAKISRLYLIDEAIYRSRVENAAGTPPEGGWLPLVRDASRTPRLDPEAARAIAEADVIVYGPGTQHSSLFPSYMTEGVGEAIAANQSADKIFIGNITRDLDMQEDDINDLARKFLEAMNRGGAAAGVEWKDCVTHFFVQDSQSVSGPSAKYIPFDPSKFLYPIETVHVRDWEAVEGRHSGGFVVDELQRIVQTRIDIELQRVQHMVSIVVPVLNEAATLGEVLESLLALDFHELGVTKEIIVVDGGSTDGSREIAQGIRTVRVYEASERGRGAALRLGIEKARGSIIAFFPGDREYRTSDLQALITTLVQSKYRAVFGTRAVKVRDLSEQLKGIYANQRALYLTSKYGGMLLSIATLLLYNRYISDVLTSVKAFDAALLRDLGLRGSGRDLDTEICARLALRHIFVLELPVDYNPRTRAEGKKITLADGVKALYSLVRCRFS